MAKTIKIKGKGATTLKYTELTPFQDDLKDLPKDEYESLRKEIIEVGFTYSIDVWAHDGINHIEDGHQRLRVIKQMVEVEGWTCPPLPVSYVYPKDEKEARRVLLSGASVYGRMTVEGAEVQLQKAGFDWKDVPDHFRFPDIKIPNFDPEAEEDEVPDIPKKATTKLGDVWELGGHTLVCGDSTEDRKNEMAAFCFTSPPYSEMRDYGGSNLSTGHLAKFIKKDVCDFYAVVLGLCRKNGEIYQYWDEYINHARGEGLKLTSWNIWSRAGMGGSIANMSHMFPIEHEWIFVFGGGKDRVARTKANKSAGLHTGISNIQKDGTTKRVKPKEVLEFGRMGSVFESCYAAGTTEFDHPAMFPVKLPAAYIEACSKKGDLIYEPFAGAGTTLIAAEQLNRKCYAIEIEPKYCDVIVERWQNLTGGKAKKSGSKTEKAKASRKRLEAKGVFI